MRLSSLSRALKRAQERSKNEAMIKIQTQILQAITNISSSGLGINDVQLSKHLEIDLPEIQYHLDFLSEAGYIKLFKTPNFAGVFRFVENVTPKGYMALQGKLTLDNKVKSGTKKQTFNIKDSNYIQIGSENIINILGEPREVGKTQIKEILAEIIKLSNQLNLEEQLQRDLNSDLATVQAQLENSNPKKSILKESLQGIKGILKGALEKAAATELAPLIHLSFEKISYILSRLG